MEPARDEFADIRWGFRTETLQFLDKIKEAIGPRLEPVFEMICGDVCCGTCASFEVGRGMDTSGKVFGLYWTIQDEEGLDETGEGLYIGFMGDTDELALQGANHIIQVMEDYGIVTLWDHTIAHRIYVKADLGRRTFPRATQPKLDC